MESQTLQQMHQQTSQVQTEELGLRGGHADRPSKHCED